MQRPILIAITICTLSNALVNLAIADEMGARLAFDAEQESKSSQVQYGLRKSGVSPRAYPTDAGAVNLGRSQVESETLRGTSAPGVGNETCRCLRMGP